MKTPIFTALFCVASLLEWRVADAAEAPGLKFGSVAMDIPAEMYRRLSPLTKYLSDTVGQPVTLKLSPDMPAAINEVTTSGVDIAYLTPVAYVRARQGGARLVAAPRTEGSATFQLVIVVKDNSPIKSAADLAGKSFAFGDKAAILQRATVVGAGVPLEKLRDYKFIGHYDNIARAVDKGDFDAGILKDTTAAAWKGKGLRVIYASPNLPPYNIVVSKNVDDATLQKLMQAFLRLDIKNPLHAKVIHTLDEQYDGFATAKDEDYDVVRSLIRPFEKG